MQTQRRVMGNAEPLPARPVQHAGLFHRRLASLAVPLEKYQAIVIGSGQGGTPLSKALAKSGLRTALIERQHVGGTCVNEGCTPTKTMVASARVAYLAQRGADYGVRTGDVQVDMERVRERKRRMVDSFRTGDEMRIANTPISS